MNFLQERKFITQRTSQISLKTYNMNNNVFCPNIVAIFYYRINSKTGSHTIVI